MNNKEPQQLSLCAVTNLIQKTKLTAVLSFADVISVLKDRYKFNRLNFKFMLI